eukprot:COSAG06_NODE_15197_length_1090_cov_2.500505_1_plen_79_part_00
MRGRPRVLVIIGYCLVDRGVDHLALAVDLMEPRGPNCTVKTPASVAGLAIHWDLDGRRARAGPPRGSGLPVSQQFRFL